MLFVENHYVLKRDCEHCKKWQLANSLIKPVPVDKIYAIDDVIKIRDLTPSLRPH
jgi:hypothetical protein